MVVLVSAYGPGLYASGRSVGIFGSIRRKEVSGHSVSIWEGGTVDELKNLFVTV